MSGLSLSCIGVLLSCICFELNYMCMSLSCICLACLMAINASKHILHLNFFFIFSYKGTHNLFLETAISDFLFVPPGWKWCEIFKKIYILIQYLSFFKLWTNSFDVTELLRCLLIVLQPLLSISASIHIVINKCRKFSDLAFCQTYEVIVII